jgi:hypothetical protein
MATIEQHKTKLIQRILDIPNEKTLLAIDNLLNSLSTKVSVSTTSNEKKAISKGFSDIEKGEFFSQETIDQMDLQWLKEK